MNALSLTPAQLVALSDISAAQASGASADIVPRRGPTPRGMLRRGAAQVAPSMLARLIACGAVRTETETRMGVDGWSKDVRAMLTPAGRALL